MPNYVSDLILFKNVSDKRSPPSLLYLTDDAVLLISIVTLPKEPNPPPYIAAHFLFVNPASQSTRKKTSNTLPQMVPPQWDTIASRPITSCSNVAGCQHKHGNCRMLFPKGCGVWIHMLRTEKYTFFPHWVHPGAFPSLSSADWCHCPWWIWSEITTEKENGKCESVSHTKNKQTHTETNTQGHTDTETNMQGDTNTQKTHRDTDMHTHRCRKVERCANMELC